MLQRGEVLQGSSVLGEGVEVQFERCLPGPVILVAREEGGMNAGVFHKHPRRPGKKNRHVVYFEFGEGGFSIRDGGNEIGIFGIVKDGGWVTEGDYPDAVRGVADAAVVVQEGSVHPLETVTDLQLAQGIAELEEAQKDGTAHGGCAVPHAKLQRVGRIPVAG